MCESNRVTIAELEAKLELAQKRIGELEAAHKDCPNIGKVISRKPPEVSHQTEFIREGCRTYSMNQFPTKEAYKQAQTVIDHAKNYKNKIKKEKI